MLALHVWARAALTRKRSGCMGWRVAEKLAGVRLRERAAGWRGGGGCFALRCRERAAGWGAWGGFELRCGMERCRAGSIYQDHWEVGSAPNNQWAFGIKTNPTCVWEVGGNGHRASMSLCSTR